MKKRGFFFWFLFKERERERGSLKKRGPWRESGAGRGQRGAGGDLSGGGRWRNSRAQPRCPPGPGSRSPQSLPEALSDGVTVLNPRLRPTQEPSRIPARTTGVSSPAHSPQGGAKSPTPPSDP